MSARDDAIKAMLPKLGVPIGRRGCEALLDAIPTEAGTRLFAIERGGMEQVGWQRPVKHAETIHRLRRTDDEAKRKGERPVYRLTEEDDTDG